ncbi:MAG: NAD-binding protein [SAR324 cluster bacterium]|nr:NAD-binding protein [SAR324 cluster bacterium]
MISSQKRLFMLLLAFPVLLVAFALLYMFGMNFFEHQPRSFLQSLEWAAETLTTTGYGQDARWTHPAMVIFVILLQFIGVFLVFLVIPIYLIPFLEERFEVKLPKAAPKLKDHIIIYQYGPAVVTLLEEFKQAGISALVMESDETVARKIHTAGTLVIFGDLESGILEMSNLLQARALIANGTDDENAALILTARQLGFEGEILAMVETPNHRNPIILTGATAVYTPQHMLAAALAVRASTRLDPHIAQLQQLGNDLRLAEIRIRPQSTIAGKTLKTANIGSLLGVTVIAQWVQGHLNRPTASMVMEPNGILVVFGRDKGIKKLTEIAGSSLATRLGGHFVIGGFGEVGRKVKELLDAVGEPSIVIDKETMEGVSYVGDIFDTKVINELDLPNARALILALDTDSATLFATVVIKEMFPDLPVIARVNRAENLERIYMAGADFALSVSQVSGQVIAHRLLGEEAINVDPQVKLLKISAQKLANTQLQNLQIREKTGCSIVAVERKNEEQAELILSFQPDFSFQENDTIYICGSNRGVRRFSNIFGET